MSSCGPKDLIFIPKKYVRKKLTQITEGTVNIDD